MRHLVLSRCRLSSLCAYRGALVAHWALLCAILAAGCMAGAGYAQESGGAPAVLRTPDVRYEPSEMDVVQAMLRLANVKPGDVVYDLGCGDGRIVIAAVRQANARGVCVDIDPQRIAESRENARLAGVSDRIRVPEPGLAGHGHQQRDGGDAVPVGPAEPQGSSQAPARAQARHPHRLALARHGRLDAPAD